MIHRDRDHSIREEIGASHTKTEHSRDGGVRRRMASGTGISVEDQKMAKTRKHVRCMIVSRNSRHGMEVDKKLVEDCQVFDNVDKGSK